MGLFPGLSCPSSLYRQTCSLTCQTAGLHRHPFQPSPPCPSTSCQFVEDGKEAAGGGHLCNCLCGLGMGATCRATIWKRSHLGEPGDALTFPFCLEGSLQGRGGYRRHEDSSPRPKALCRSFAYDCGRGRMGKGCGLLRG